MNADHSIGDPAELAALYMAGAMPPAQAAEFELHLDSGCKQCLAALRGLDIVGAALCTGVEPVAPSPDVRRRLLAAIDSAESAPVTPDAGPKQIWREWNADAARDPLFIRRAGEGAWEQIGIDGIEIRRLFVDAARDQATMLVRMGPGTAYPRHIHHGPEECFVLAGELRVGETVLRAGDYQRAAPSSRHAVQSTDGGCLLLIVTSLSDELE